MDASNGALGDFAAAFHLARVEDAGAAEVERIKQVYHEIERRDGGRHVLQEFTSFHRYLSKIGDGRSAAALRQLSRRA